MSGVVREGKIIWNNSNDLNKFVEMHMMPKWGDKKHKYMQNKHNMNVIRKCKIHFIMLCLVAHQRENVN